MIFTTSWDDGTVSDLRIAELLETYHCTGTFYLCPAHQACYREPLLTNDKIQILSNTHEIGAHTMSHPHLPSLSDKDAVMEIQKSKHWVEAVTGKPCTMFCYPFGDHNDRIRRMVSENGFKGARTVSTGQFEHSDSFALGTTLHLYPFPIRPVFNRRCLDPLRTAWPHMKSCRLPLAACRSWLSLAQATFRYAERSGMPWFHLWGHGWEIERYGMWGDLETFLAFVQEQNDVACIPNSQLL